MVVRFHPGVPVQLSALRNDRTTQLLKSFAAGEQGAMEKLLPLVYDELHRLAEQIMAGDAKHHTLQPTALIHEAYRNVMFEVTNPVELWVGQD